MTFTPGAAIAGPPGKEAQDREARLGSRATATQTGLRGSQVPWAAGQGKAGEKRRVTQSKVSSGRALSAAVHP